MSLMCKGRASDLIYNLLVETCSKHETNKKKPAKMGKYAMQPFSETVQNVLRNLKMSEANSSTGQGHCTFATGEREKRTGFVDIKMGLRLPSTADDPETCTRNDEEKKKTVKTSEQRCTAVSNRLRKYDVLETSKDINCARWNGSVGTPLDKTWERKKG